MLKQNLRIEDHEKDKANRPAHRGGAGAACGCIRRQDCAGYEEQRGQRGAGRGQHPLGRTDQRPAEH